MQETFCDYYENLNKELVIRLIKEGRLSFDSPTRIRLQDLYITDYQLKQIELFINLVNTVTVSTDLFKIFWKYYWSDDEVKLNSELPDVGDFYSRTFVVLQIATDQTKYFLNNLERVYYSILTSDTKSQYTIYSLSGSVGTMNVSSSYSGILTNSLIPGDITINNSYIKQITVFSDFKANQQEFTNSYCTLKTLPRLRGCSKTTKAKNSHITFIYENSYTPTNWLIQANLSGLIDTLKLEDDIGGIYGDSVNTTSLTSGMLKENLKTIVHEFSAFNFEKVIEGTDSLPYIVALRDGERYELGCFNTEVINTLPNRDKLLDCVTIEGVDEMFLTDIFDCAEIVLVTPDLSLTTASLPTAPPTEITLSVDKDCLVVRRKEEKEVPRIHLEFTPRLSQVANLEPSGLPDPPTAEDIISFLKSVRLSYASTFTKKTKEK